MLDWAWEGDRDSADFVEREIDGDLLEEVFVEVILVLAGGEADGVKELTGGAKQGDEGFGAADVDTEIHENIITLREGRSLTAVV